MTFKLDKNFASTIDLVDTKELVKFVVNIFLKNIKQNLKQRLPDTEFNRVYSYKIVKEEEVELENVIG